MHFHRGADDLECLAIRLFAHARREYKGQAMAFTR